MDMNFKVQNSSTMHSFYYASRNKAENNTFHLNVNEHAMETDASGILPACTTSEWPDEETLNPAFITFNKGLTGYDSVEYFYDLTSDEDNPIMYMRTKSGGEEGYHKIDINSVNIATATKAELLGYYSYQEYSGKDVDMYQLMADMDMSEHNGYVNKNDKLQEAFLKCTANWLQALKYVWENQKTAGDNSGAAATLNLIELSKKD